MQVDSPYSPRRGVGTGHPCQHGLIALDNILRLEDPDPAVSGSFTASIRVNQRAAWGRVRLLGRPDPNIHFQSEVNARAAVFEQAVMVDSGSPVDRG